MDDADRSSSAPGAASPQDCVRNCVFRVVEQDGQQKVAVECCGEDWATCDNLVLNHAGQNRITVVAREHQVVLNGANLHACADRVVRKGPDNCIQLEGHVRLRYHCQGEKAEITAEHVVVGLSDGHVEIVPARKQSDIAKAPGESQLPTPCAFHFGLFR